MAILICIKGKNKVKIFLIGNMVSHLMMLVAACKAASEKVATEKMISLHDAMKFILKCIADTNGSLN